MTRFYDFDGNWIPGLHFSSKFKSSVPYQQTGIVLRPDYGEAFRRREGSIDEWDQIPYYDGVRQAMAPYHTETEIEEYIERLQSS